MKEILVSVDDFEDRLAILEDGDLVEIHIARGERMVGSIYKGKVANVLPGMQAAFVDIGMEKNAFLCIDDIAPGFYGEEEDMPWSSRAPSIEQILKVRQEALVQVVKEPVGAKGGRITTNLALPGRYLVFLPMSSFIGVSRKIEEASERERLRALVERLRPKEMGVIVRTAAEGKGEKELARDLEFLSTLWDRILQRSEHSHAPALVHQEAGLVFRALRDYFSEEVSKCIIDNRHTYAQALEFAEILSRDLKGKMVLYEGKKPLFEQYAVEHEIEKALRKRVWLPSGGYIVIEPTEALTVIDVNTGRFVGSTSLGETILKTNLEAAREIGRQIRLRDLSGIIVIDFIDMENEKDRQEVVQTLSQVLKNDKVKSYVLGMTSLGLVELTRKRMGRNLNQILREDCYYCGGKGKVLTPETVSYRLQREMIREAREAHHDAVLAQAHPLVVAAMIGWEGERIKKLEEETRKSIFLRSHSTLHQEKFHLHWGSKEDLERSVRVLHPGEEITVPIQEPGLLNVQSGIGFFEGILVEVTNGGNKIGESLKVLVTHSLPSYAIAQIE